MRLDAVFLVAPKPKPPSIPTRRAFLIAGGMFATGAVLGGACGYSIGAAAGSGPAAAPGAEPDLVPSGDVELDELRRLAVKAPIEELVERGLLFLSMRVESYKTDAVLWRGVDRLSLAMVENASLPITYGLVGVVIVTIESGGFPPSLQLQDRLPALRELKMRLRQRK